MRYIIKGGVWKNSEDEILKAAVMKYGLNQWSRISSLLVRKSARQCKARWYEWLDPSIKKTEWTREEEEKLLHLAKIFPCQWRTIAPIVGRTPAQCVEHYEKLLDQAQGKTGDDENDPRKLKPGEIEPTPESKPARPDPVDMDEDEKEMLAEARVRLANTKGKKAKRKAREKQIEEARRLANLQKKRELKAAGIDFVLKKKNTAKKIDYNEEIPFERKAPKFAYETGADEDPKPNLNVGNIVLQTLEGKRREEDEEKLRKIDQRKIKKLKEKDLPTALQQINKVNAMISSAKTKLTLPTPQLNDNELELLGKLNSVESNLTDSNPITKTLIGDYSQREPLPTPLRTPRYQDALMKEARNVLALQNVQTPLEGGINQPLNDPDFSGLTPKPKIPVTPNVLAQNINQQMNLNSALPTPKRTMESIRGTPLHDELKLNTEDPFDKNWEASSMSQTSQKINEIKMEKMRIIHQQNLLKNSLGDLPKPKNVYQLELPEMEEELPTKNTEVLDAEEELKIKRRQIEIENEKKLKSRSLAIQKNLPRPFVINEKLYEELIEDETIPAIRREAEKMLSEEIVTLLAQDSLDFPFPNSKAPNYMPNKLHFSLNEISFAESLILEEIDAIKEELKHGDISKEAISNAWNAFYKNYVFYPNKKRFVELSTVDKSEKNQILKSSLEYQKFLLTNEEKILSVIEQKTGILIGGYIKKNNLNQKLLEDHFFEIDQKKIEKDVFSRMHEQEKKSIQARIEEFENFYQALQKKEAILQKRYEQLVNEKKEELNTNDILFNKSN